MVRKTAENTEPKKRGRKRKEFPPDEEAAIIAALSSGKSTRQVAADFGHPESTIRTRFAELSNRTAIAARQAADEASRVVGTLPAGVQGIALAMAYRMQQTAALLGDAAYDSAVVAAKAAAIARRQAEKIDASVDEPDFGRLAKVAGATKIAREAASLGLQMLAIGIEKTRVVEPSPSDVAPKSIDVKILDASLSELDDANA